MGSSCSKCENRAATSGNKIAPSGAAMTNHRRYQRGLDSFQQHSKATVPTHDPLNTTPSYLFPKHAKKENSPMFSLANNISLAPVTFKPTPPVPQWKVISSAPRLARRWRLGDPPHALPPPHTLTSLWSTLDQWSHSAGPVIIDAERREPSFCLPPQAPPPTFALTLDRHLPDKITEEYCFHSPFV